MHKRYFYPIHLESQIIPKQYHNLFSMEMRKKKKEPCAKCKCCNKQTNKQMNRVKKMRKIFAHTKTVVNFNNNR